MATKKLAIDILNGIWVINVLRYEGDQFAELLAPKKERLVTDLNEGETYPVTISIRATPGTPFKVTADDEVLLDDVETGEDEMWTGYVWMSL